jgi:hypothetical protein
MQPVNHRYPSPLNDVPARSHGQNRGGTLAALRPRERNRYCLRVNFAVRLFYGSAPPGVRPQPSCLRRTRFAPTIVSECAGKIGENGYTYLMYGLLMMLATRRWRTAEIRIRSFATIPFFFSTADKLRSCSLMA